MIVHQIHFESVPVLEPEDQPQLRVTVRLHMLTSSPLSLCSRQPGIAPISVTDTALSSANSIFLMRWTAPASGIEVP